MAKNLVIVESPTKVKPIKKFLGSNYTVEASGGHVRDLPKSSMGIDVDDDYEPKYITIRGKGEVLAKLRKEAAKADRILLATDPDREGEAISWHLTHALKLDPKKTKRITFNEITKDAVKNATKHARDLDMDLVDAQQARRAVDRIVGYRISPILWKKVKRGLSAGRVQSVALRIIADREAEINAFVPEEYWTLDASLNVCGEKGKMIAHFSGKNGRKQILHSEEDVRQIICELENEQFRIKDVKVGTRIKKAPLPFTTSTMQQEANKQLNYPAVKTMRIAQQLYEGIDMKGSGTIGLISYLRTDSTRISEEADRNARDFIRENYGSENVIKGEARVGNVRHAQDAHEAIRPTDITRTPASVKNSLSRDQFRLYQLIWRRFAASRMADAVYETTAVKVQAGEYSFSASASGLVFRGFLNIYGEDEEKTEGDNRLLGAVSESSELIKEDFSFEQHFTQPPARYTESSLIKTLEELGIGRPSTYAPTIAIILARRYVVKENKNLYLTEIGEVVDKMMKQSFPDIVDVNFTANMEAQLDSVEEGKLPWKNVLREFYPNLDKEAQKAEEELEKVRITDEVSDVICENCGRNMVIKYGSYGKFLACPGFPECRNTKPFLEKTGVTCPKCGGDVVYRKTKKGRKYYGCSNNPECDFMSWQKPSEKKCPNCGNYMLEKGNKLVCSDIQCGYSESNK